MIVGVVDKSSLSSSGRKGKGRANVPKKTSHEPKKDTIMNIKVFKFISTFVLVAFTVPSMVNAAPASGGAGSYEFVRVGTFDGVPLLEFPPGSGDFYETPVVNLFGVNQSDQTGMLLLTSIYGDLEYGVYDIKKGTYESSGDRGAPGTIGTLNINTSGWSVSGSDCAYWDPQGNEHIVPGPNLDEVSCSPRSISDNLVIAGFLNGSDGMLGFTYDIKKDEFTSIPVSPDRTILQNINSKGEIAGDTAVIFYDDDGDFIGYELRGLVRESDGHIRLFLIDNGDGTVSTDTRARGINNQGQIVGWYYGSSGEVVAFLAELPENDPNGEDEVEVVTPIARFGFAETGCDEWLASGINDSGTIVGLCVESSGDQPLVIGTPKPPGQE